MKHLRIIILGDFDNYLSYFTYGCLEGGIRCGHLVRPIPFFGHDLSIVKNQILWFKPHILIAHMLFGCSRWHKQENVFQMLSELRKQGIFIVYHNGDARKDPRYPHDISSIVDLGLLNQDRCDYYSNIWKIPVIRWPYMCLYQKDIVDPVDLYRCNIAFTGELGGGVHRERTEFIHKLQSQGIDVKIFPTNETGNTRFQTAELAASANMVLGMQMESHLKGYLDVRPFQYIGAGALYLHDECEQIREHFISNIHYAEYDKKDIKKLLDILDWFKKSPLEARGMRERGFKYCQQNHSTKQRIEAVLEAYNRLK